MTRYFVVLAGYKYRARILDVSSDRRKSYEINRAIVAGTKMAVKCAAKMYAFRDHVPRS